MRKKKSQIAFTLIEMLVVLAIMGMILAISVPAFDAVIRTSKVSEGAKLIYKTLEFARQHAISHGTNTMVVFDAVSSVGGRTGYKVYVPGTGDIEDWEFLFNGVNVDTSSMSTGNIGSSNDGDGDGSVRQVTFTPAGTPNSTATIMVEATSGSALSRRVTYSNMSGYIRLYGLGE